MEIRPALLVVEDTCVPDGELRDLALFWGLDFEAFPDVPALIETLAAGRSGCLVAAPGAGDDAPLLERAASAGIAAVVLSPRRARGAPSEMLRTLPAGSSFDEVQAAVFRALEASRRWAHVRAVG